MRSRARRYAAAIALGLLAAPGARAAAPPPAAIVVAAFDYVDTSGEQADQAEAHAARLRAFTAAMRAGLAQGGRYRVLALPCGDACSAREEGGAPLLAAARAAGARLLLVGAIHKESTLIQWVKADLVDVDRDTVVFERLLTFRGDTDAAWQHAADFLLRQIEQPPPPP